MTVVSCNYWGRWWGDQSYAGPSGSKKKTNTAPSVIPPATTWLSASPPGWPDTWYKWVISRTNGSFVFSTVTLDTAARFSSPRLRCSSWAIRRVASAIPRLSVQSDETIKFQFVGTSSAAELYSIASLYSPYRPRSASTTLRTSLTSVKTGMLELRWDNS